MECSLEQKVVLILRAARILVENGAETWRVENTMDWMGKNLDVNVQSFVTPTGIFITAEDSNRSAVTRVRRVVHRGFELAKIAAVNDFSRNYDFQVSTWEEAMDHLKEIDRRDAAYPWWLVMIAAGLSSACFAVLFGGNIYDMFPALVAGIMAQYVLHIVASKRMFKFSSSFFGGLTVAVTAIAFTRFIPEANLGKIIIGAIMPLVPGVAITSAARDLVSDNLLSGIARAGEALMIAAAIAAGAAVAFFV